MQHRMKPTGIFQVKQMSSLELSNNLQPQQYPEDWMHSSSESVRAGPSETFFRDGRPQFIKIGPVRPLAATQIWDLDSQEDVTDKPDPILVSEDKRKFAKLGQMVKQDQKQSLTWRTKVQFHPFSHSK